MYDIHVAQCSPPFLFLFWLMTWFVDMESTHYHLHFGSFVRVTKGFTLMWGLWKIRAILQSSGDNGPDRDKAKDWALLVQHKRSWQVDHWLIPVRSTEVLISKQEARNPERQGPESNSVASILQHTSSQNTKESFFATWTHGYKSEMVPLCAPPTHTHQHTPKD